MTMLLKDALALVFDLAKENALNQETCDRELTDEALRQKEALDIVERTFLKVLHQDQFDKHGFVRPFFTSGELHIPLHAMCWPSAYMTIHDTTKKFQLVVPAVVDRVGERMIPNKEKTLTEALRLVALLNTAPEVK